MISVAVSGFVALQRFVLLAFHYIIIVCCKALSASSRVGKAPPPAIKINITIFKTF